MMRRALTLPLFLAAMLLSPALLHADNEGLEDLDKATEAKLEAKSFQDYAEVVKLAQSALDKGLDKENAEFAESLLVSTLLERATLLSSAIFNKEGPDPRWPQIRQVALADLERVVQLDPTQIEAHLMIARLHVLPGGDRDRSRKALDAALDVKDIEKDTKIDALVLRGNLQEEDDARLSDYAAALKLDPNNADVLRTRGMYHLTQERYKQATRDLNEAVKLDSDSAGTYEALGLAQLLQEKYDAAIKSLNEAIKRAPEAPTPYAHRARAYAMQDKLKKALADLDKAADVDPDNLSVLLLRARLHYQMDNKEEAIADVDEILKLQPNSVAAARLRAEMLAGSGKLDEAITDMKRMSESSPENVELALQLGAYYAADMQIDRAIEVFTEVLSDDPGNIVALRRRADAYLNIGEQAKAVADYEKALKYDDEEPGILNNLAWVLATSPEDDLRNGERAIELARQACEITDYKQAHILSTLAAAYAETGNFEKAIEWSQKAVEVAGDDEELSQLKDELKSYKKEKPWREVQQVEQKKTDTPAPGDPAPAQTSDF